VLQLTLRVTIRTLVSAVSHEAREAQRRLPVLRPRPSKEETSFVVYRGPSAFDGEPIVAIVTGVTKPGRSGASRNTKTGPMAQLYVLRADEAPTVALKSGGDASVCGDCALRPKKAGSGIHCYVNVAFGPTMTWKSNAEKAVALDACIGAMKRHEVHLRLGAYGDPAALPERVVARLAGASKGARGFTGYSHDWRNPRSAWLRKYAMASVESKEDEHAAFAAGWRTFRILRAEGELLLDDEILCPTSTHDVHCDDCRLCDGVRTNEAHQEDRRKVVAIPVHGPQPRAVIRIQTDRKGAKAQRSDPEDPEDPDAG